LDYFNQINI